jgi:hypothetical protein
VDARSEADGAWTVEAVAGRAGDGRLAHQAGFSRTEIRYLNAPDRHEDARLNEHLFAPLDYALVATA